MALFDVDKNRPDRSTPVPNHSDSIPEDARMAHQTVSSHYNPPGTINTSGRLYQVGKTFFANDGSTDRAIFGYNAATGTWGSFAVKPGADIKTANPSNYAFSSDYDSFKIVSANSDTIPSYTTSGAEFVIKNKTIPHGLTSIPAINAYALVSIGISYSGTVSFANGYVPLPYPRQFYEPYSNITAYEIYAVVDATNVYLVYSGSASATVTFPAVSIKYYLLQETAN